MRDNDFVALARARCPICLADMDSDTILIHRRLRPIPEKDRYIGLDENPCEECRKKLGEDRIAMVGIDPEKSSDAFLPNGNADPYKVFRIGEVIFLRRAAYDRMIDVPAPKGRICFVEPEVIRMLLEMAKRAEPAGG